MIFPTEKLGGISAFAQRQIQQKSRFEWSSSDAPHWRADARRALARRRTTHVRRRAEGRRRAHPNLEAEEAGQVHVDLRKNLDQLGGQTSARSRPPVLKAVGRRSTGDRSKDQTNQDQDTTIAYFAEGEYYD